MQQQDHHSQQRRQEKQDQNIHANNSANNNNNNKNNNNHIKDGIATSSTVTTGGTATTTTPVITTECHRCMTHLARTLLTPSSRPRILLEKMGASLPQPFSFSSSTSGMTFPPTAASIAAMDAKRKEEDERSKQIIGMKEMVIDSSNSSIGRGNGGEKLADGDDNITTKMGLAVEIELKKYSPSSETSERDGSVTVATADTNNKNRGDDKAASPVDGNVSLISRISRRFHSNPAATSTPTSTSPDDGNNTKLPRNNNTNDNNNNNIITIQCQPCGTTGPEASARAFVKGPSPLTITLCSNRLPNPSVDIPQVLTHELIHVYDVQYNQLDLRQCNSLAYSEVRAAREAECFNVHRFWKNKCIRDCAEVATGNMFPEGGLGGKCVQEVFEEAMKDYTPFAEKKKEKDVKTKGTAVNVTSNTTPAASSSSSPTTVDWTPSSR